MRSGFFSPNVEIRRDLKKKNPQMQLVYVQTTLVLNAGFWNEPRIHTQKWHSVIKIKLQLSSPFSGTTRLERAHTLSLDFCAFTSAAETPG